MNPEFKKAYREQECEWLDWIGHPMLFDGALFVERDQHTPEVENRVRKELVAHPHIFSTSTPTTQFLKHIPGGGPQFL